MPTIPALRDAAKLDGSEMIPMAQGDGSTVKAAAAMVAGLVPPIDPDSLAQLVGSGASSSASLVDVRQATIGTLTQLGSANAQLASIFSALGGTLKVAMASLPMPVAGPANRAAAAGSMFGVSTGAVALTTTGLTGMQLVASLVNPAGSGKSLYVQSVRLSSGVPAACYRYRIAGGTPGGTALAPANSSGGSLASVARLYLAPTGLTVSSSVDMATFLAAGGATTQELDGAIVLPPGSSLLWAAGAQAAIVPTLLYGLGSIAVAASWWEA